MRLSASTVETVFRRAIVISCPVFLCHRLGAMRSHELKAQIAELHPYEIPAIYSLEVVDVNASYLEWVNQNTL
ncbi:divalent cation tolerance protein CutA [Chromatium okenii]|uniref:Divalent-cation tolerance protein CutA n=1 Tax=Chromatium okenii TaxID=61644 RepID=A0A2S7XLX8_9GAMM|nr:divalent cation tolerance protein CutA [Chromatium okenii]PQJ94749.1 hypothetical protein CXB77_18425 [Chromatium okenii]